MTKQEKRTRSKKKDNSLRSRWINYEEQITERRKLEHKERTERQREREERKNQDGGLTLT